MSRNLKKGQLRLAEHRRIPWQEKVEKTAVSRAHLKYFGAGMDDIEKNAAKMQLTDEEQAKMVQGRDIEGRSENVENGWK